MTDPILPIDPETLGLPIQAAREAGRQAAEAYRSRAPFPHNCYDNLLPPEILENSTKGFAACPRPKRSFIHLKRDIRFQI